MKVAAVLLFFMLILSACSGTASDSTPNASSSEPRVVYTGGGVKQLKELEGKRIRQIELWDAQDMDARFSKLLGEDYPAMKSGWMIESPIVVDGDILMAAGCDWNNNCPQNQYVMFVNVANDNINVL